MLTKGIILNRVVGDNKYMVRIPILESAGDKEISRVASILSLTPGIYESYDEGDVVVIGFENHSAYNPVILGKLMMDGDSSARGFANLLDLEAKNSAKLPKNTTIGGYDMSSINKTISVLGDRIDDNRSDIASMKLPDSASDGTYVWKATKTNGIVSYQWVKE